KTEEDTVKITVELGFPPIDAISSFDLLIRDFKELSDISIRDTDGFVLSQSDWQNGNIIIAFLDPEKESSISTTKRLALINDIPLFIFVKTDKKDNALHFCHENNLNGRIFYGDEENLKEILKFRELPSILFLQDGKAILWTEGLNLEISNMIRQIKDN
ncbi:hypothetical protein KAX35_06770, partial [candidate division WOR-3 bacterium]|nr:hypothetical protein [candidate division WOR-3 bacterium]